MGRSAASEVVSGRINKPSPGETDKNVGCIVLRIVRRSPGRTERFERAALGSLSVVKQVYTRKSARVKVMAMKSASDSRV